MGTKIEWATHTWNPITGCTKHSAGCLNCYAERMAKRLQATGADAYQNGFAPSFHDHLVERPLSWKKSRRIFVNSMSDTFHENITDDQILSLFNVMNKARWHTFQVLTKRTERLLKLSPEINWTPNIWQGVTVEHAATRSRIEDLRLVGAHTKFLSIEPLIGPVTGLNLSGIDWVIVGGESGPGARPLNPDWVRSIRDQCADAGVPFMFKQWGDGILTSKYTAIYPFLLDGISLRKAGWMAAEKKGGRLLDGKIHDEYPIIQI